VYLALFRTLIRALFLRTGVRVVLLAGLLPKRCLGDESIESMDIDE